jgi:hypothetical protein
VLEKRFGLLHGFKPDQGEAIFATLESLLQPEALETWQRRRAKMLDVWADPTNVYWEELSRFLAAPAQVEA